MNFIRALLARTDSAIAWIGTAGAAFSCVLLLLMSFGVFLDIVLRAIAGRSLDFITEFVGYAVAAMTFATLAYAFRRGELIRVSLIAGPLSKHPRLDQLFHGVVLFLTAMMMSVAAWYFWVSINRHLARGTVSPTSAEVPLWIPESFVLAGIVLFLLQALMQLLNLLAGNREHAGETLGRVSDNALNQTGAH